MNESSATERLSRLLRERSVDAHPRADRPDPDQIWLAVRRELPLEGRLAVIDHTASCAACAEAWRIAKECAADADAGAIAVDASSASAARPPRRAALWWLAAAAVIVLAAGSAYLIRPRGTVDPIFRDPGGRVPASEIAPGTALARDGFVLKWTPGPAGAKYNLIRHDRESGCRRQRARHRAPPVPVAGDGLVGPLVRHTAALACRSRGARGWQRGIRNLHRHAGVASVIRKDPR